MIEYCIRKNKLLLTAITIISIITIILYSIYFDKEYLLRTSTLFFRNSSFERRLFFHSSHINHDQSFFEIYDNENNTFTFGISNISNISELKIINPHPYEFTINHIDLCNNNRTDLLLLITVITAVTHFEERQTIRDTWGGYARELGAKLLFFIGHPFQENLQKDIVEEDNTYHDIIQENFLDTYLNLSIKTLSTLKWVSEYCFQVKLVLKIDDDNFLNADQLYRFVNDKVQPKSMYGLLAHEWKPMRDPDSKWFVPTEVYSSTYYPDFMAGPAYLFTGDCAPILYKASFKIAPLYLEDVYVTGILAEFTGVQRFNLNGINNNHQIITPCSFKTMINSHEHSPKDILRVWNLIHRKFFICFS